MCKEESNERRGLRICWSKKAINIFKERTDSICWESKRANESLEEKWARLKEIVHGAMVREEEQV